MSIRQQQAEVDWWLENGERGISSETIVSVITGQSIIPRNRRSHPYDPADFRRCEVLLRRCPSLRPSFLVLMPRVSPAWRALVERWDEIAQTIEEEVPGVFDGRVEGDAPRAYALMCDCRQVAAS